MTWLDSIADKAVDRVLPDRSEALAVLASGDDELLDVVAAAFRVRRHYFGRRVKLNYLVNIKSGLCPEDCFYCSQRSGSSADVLKYTWLKADDVLASAQVSSGVAPPVPRVPHTVTPAWLAAPTSIDAFAIPVVTSSRRPGSSRMRSAVNGVRSRIATITSNGRSSATRSAVSAMWPWNGTMSDAPSTPQSALCMAIRW